MARLGRAPRALPQLGSPGGYKQPCRSSEYHGARRSKVPVELARQASNLRPRREKSEGNETHTTGGVTRGLSPVGVCTLTRIWGCFTPSSATCLAPSSGILNPLRPHPARKRQR